MLSTIRSILFVLQSKYISNGAGARSGHGVARVAASEVNMPIKSQAQRRKFAELLVNGKISNEVYERWNRGAGSKELPERVTPKAKSKGRKRATSKRAKT